MSRVQDLKFNAHEDDCDGVGDADGCLCSDLSVVDFPPYDATVVDAALVLREAGIDGAMYGRWLAGHR